MAESINVEKRVNKAKDMGIMIILLTAVLFLIAYLFYREQQFVQVAQNQYSQSFYDLVSYTENVETMLAKTMASNSSEYTAQNLVNVWREANLAQNALSKIPININMLEDTNNYLNQVSDYSYSLSRACMSGQELTEEQKNNLVDIYGYSTKLKQQLMDVADEVKDRAAVSFLDWYLKEQVEEEANVSNVLKTLKMVCNDKQCLYMFDKELATRTFVAPVIG